MSNVVYIGKDLEAMSFALNYHRWIFEEMRPFLGRHIVEVGAGTGSFSELLAAHRPSSLSLIEPSGMYEQLIKNTATWKTDADIVCYKHVFTEIAAELERSRAPDSILYVNVLEHISDDQAELTAMYRTLRKGGRILIFVPALPRLYGAFDRRVGHFRRYTKADLENKCLTAGFKLLKSRYFDFAGVVLWWVKYQLLQSDSLESGAVRLYDKFVVPVTKTLESMIMPPIGKNVLVIAEK